MTTTTTGLEFKRFYLDSNFWPETGNTYHDDVLLHVNGRDLSDDEDPRNIVDEAVVEIRSGWVADIPADAPGGADEMSLEDYFMLWQKQQSTTTLVVECPRDHLEQVTLAVKAAGGTVKQ
jgi:hypothetical protein